MAAPGCAGATACRIVAYRSVSGKTMHMLLMLL
jgi:hypothetical protein